MSFLYRVLGISRDAEDVADVLKRQGREQADVFYIASEVVVSGGQATLRPFISLDNTPGSNVLDCTGKRFYIIGEPQKFRKALTAKGIQTRECYVF